MKSCPALYLQNAHFQIGAAGAGGLPLGIKTWSFAILKKTENSKVDFKGQFAFYLFPSSVKGPQLQENYTGVEISRLWN